MPAPPDPLLRFSPRRLVLVLACCTAGLLVSAALAVVFGEQPVRLAAAWTEPASTDAAILFRLRLPRMLLAAVVGAALGAAGCALQALLRNPLADPFVLGVSGGAALGASIALALGLGTLETRWQLLGQLLRLSAPAAFAFLGALFATALVLAWGRQQRSLYAPLLTGIIFNAFAAAAVTCIKALSDPAKIGEILHWLAGALGYESTATLTALALFELVCLGFLWARAAELNLLSLGDGEAASLGVDVRRVRTAILVVTSLIVAAAVAVSGLIGFVGLIVPHVLRLLLGPDQRLLLPASAVAGAAFLVLADLLARMLFRALATEPPVGVVTALIGGPLFLWLLKRREEHL